MLKIFKRRFAQKINTNRIKKYNKKFSGFFTTIIFTIKTHYYYPSLIPVLESEYSPGKDYFDFQLIFKNFTFTNGGALTF